MPRIFVFIVHKNGVADDSAGELLAAAARIDPAEPPVAIVTGWGANLDTVCNSLCALYPVVWKVASEALTYPNAELVRKALATAVPQGCILLVPHNHFGVDLSPGLSIKLNAAYVSDVVAIESLRGSYLKIVRQEFGGQVSTYVDCDISGGAVLNVRPGAFSPDPTLSVTGKVVDQSWSVGPLVSGRRYLETVAAETDDVDISREPVLVSVGRGIQAEENVALAKELAAAMGAEVGCSRPIVDAKWLPKSRQVGSSGKTVKPKVYIACGISGSFQHLTGIKGNPFMVAINKNPKAPIFQVADIGITADVLEFLPELTRKIREASGLSKGAHQ